MSALLLNLFGAAVYELIKIISKNLFKSSSNELDKRIANAMELAVENFFDNYGTKYGKISESFLAREENWIVVTKSLRFDNPSIEINQINPNGFKGSTPADENAIRFFISSVKEEFSNDLFLNILLSIKKSIEISKKTESKMLSAIEQLSEKIIDKKKSKPIPAVQIGSVHDGQTSRSLKEGKLYVRDLSKKVKLTYMRRGNKVYVEAELDDNAVSYLEINEEGHINILEPPYPVKIHVPEKYKVKEEIISDKNGNQKLIIHGKFGLRIESDKISEETFQNTKLFNASISINSKDKIMHVTPNGLNN